MRVLFLLGVVLCVSSCQSAPPAPCDCGRAEQEMRHYTELYLESLQDTGMLRQSIKACEEKRQ